MGLRYPDEPLTMARYNRKPDPPYTPPTEAEIELGYVFTCGGCGRDWPTRLRDGRTKQCLPCSRAWRRDDMMSRRRGLGGVPLTRNPQSHMMRSKHLKREVNLNSSEAKDLISSDPLFREEVSAYVERLVAQNSEKTPLHGVLPLLSNGRRKPQKATRIELDDEPGPSPAAERAAQKAVDQAMDVIDGEVVDERHR